MTHIGTDKPTINLQPRPARRAGAIVGAVSLVTAAIPNLAEAFGGWGLTTGEWLAIVAFADVVVAAIAYYLGLQVEKQVTPVASPRDNDLVPLVPIANDGLDD